MKYVGIQTQIRRNNIMSVLLLVMFPVIILGMVWIFLALLNYFGGGYYDEYGNVVHTLSIEAVNYHFLNTIPWVIAGGSIWFIIAYFSNVAMIRQATGARPLERRENPHIYNIVENLCMAGGMEMPKINIVDDPQLNAFASGINAKTYTVTLTTGIINRLSDEELSGVVAHELTHIRNKDTRLVVVSIIFVGIISTVMSLVVRTMYHTMWMGGGTRRDNEKGNGLSMLVILLIGLVCCAIAYFFTLVTRFAISRKREYMADAGGAELCGNPMALASALRKLSADPGLDHVKQQDVAQLFIVRPDEMSAGLMSFMNTLFASHPETEKRIAILEQF